MQIMPKKNSGLGDTVAQMVEQVMVDSEVSGSILCARFTESVILSICRIDLQIHMAVQQL